MAVEKDKAKRWQFGLWQLLIVTGAVATITAFAAARYGWVGPQLRQAGLGVSCGDLFFEGPVLFAYGILAVLLCVSRRTWPASIVAAAIGLTSAVVIRGAIHPVDEFAIMVWMSLTCELLFFGVPFLGVVAVLCFVLAPRNLHHATDQNARPDVTVPIPETPRSPPTQSKPEH